LEAVFARAQYYNMRLNPEKCTFGVKAGKFLGFNLTKRGIEANLDKCRDVLEMEPSLSKERVMTLNGMLAAFSRFISKSTHPTTSISWLPAKPSFRPDPTGAAWYLTEKKKKMSHPTTLINLPQPLLNLTLWILP
jgi:hypothetical protein